jgi:hypothetical protein
LRLSSSAFREVRFVKKVMPRSSIPRRRTMRADGRPSRVEVARAIES